MQWHRVLDPSWTNGRNENGFRFVCTESPSIPLRCRSAKTEGALLLDHVLQLASAAVFWFVGQLFGLIDTVNEI